MDHYDAAGNGVGGGEILDVLDKGKSYNFDSPFMNNELIRLYQVLPIILAIIFVIILVIMIRIIMNRLLEEAGV